MTGVQTCALPISTTGLNVTNAVRVRSEDAEKGFGMHGARAYFDVIGLLQDATLLHPKLGEL